MRGGKLGLSDLTERDAVLQAMAEYDELGRDAFLSRYEYGPARSELRVICRKLADVADIRLNLEVFRGVSIHRNNSQYALLLRVSYLVCKELLPLGLPQILLLSTWSQGAKCHN